MSAAPTPLEAAIDRGSHDAFFRALLGDPRRAMILAQERLPAALWAQLDPAAPWEADDSSFIDEALQTHESDLLYRCGARDGGAVYFYVLIEHKSAPDRFAPLQLLRYMVRIWARAQADGADPLPMILPLLVHHGARPWPARARFQDLLAAPPDLARFVPSFDYVLADLGREADADLSADPALRGGLATLKYSFKEAAQRAALPGVAADLAADPALARLALRYVVGAWRRIEVDDIAAAARRSLSPEDQSMVSLFAEQHFNRGLDRGLNLGRAEGLNLGRAEGLNLGRAEGLNLGRAEGLNLGRAEGLNLGRAEGARASLQRLLTHRFGAAALERLAALGPVEFDEAERLLDRAIDATTLEAVFDTPNPQSRIRS